MTFIISLLSGLIGVIIGAIIQILYDNKLEKKRIINEYKKICVNEWLLLSKELHLLLEHPQNHNNTMFRQSIIQKTTLLNFMHITQKKYEKRLSTLQEYIKKTDETLSLGNFAEEALNKGKSSINKILLTREVSSLVNFVLSELSKF